MKLQRGASLVEYSLLVSLVAVVVIAGVTTTGNKTKCKYESIADSLTWGYSLACTEPDLPQDVDEAFPAPPGGTGGCVGMGCPG